MSQQPPNTPPPPPSGQPGQPYDPSPPPQQQPYQQAGGYQQPQQPYQQPYQQPGQAPGGYQQPGQFGGQFGGPAGFGAPGQLGERALARLVDHIVLILPMILVTVIASAIFLGGFSNGAVDYLLYGIVYSILVVAIQIGYFSFLESTRGQTVGKMVMKLKTVGPDGVSNPPMNEALKRNAFYALNLIAILPVFFSPWLATLAVLGAVVYIAVTINNDPVNRQGFHDHFAGGTRVVKIG